MAKKLLQSQPEALYQRLNKCIDEVGEKGLKALDNGLSNEENVRLMATENLSAILVLLKQGLESKFGKKKHVLLHDDTGTVRIRF